MKTSITDSVGSAVQFVVGGLIVLLILAGPQLYAFKTGSFKIGLFGLMLAALFNHGFISKIGSPYDISFENVLVPFGLGVVLFFYPPAMFQSIAVYLLWAIWGVSTAILLNAVLFRVVATKEGYDHRNTQEEKARVREAERTYKALMNDSGKGQPTAKDEIKFPARPAKHGFELVQGMEELVAELKEVGGRIVDESQNNGILLFGEPGNGKTFFVEALAGHLNIPMITVTFGNVGSKWINETTENVVAAFNDARAQAPCLLFLDEVDSVLADRGNMTGKSEESNKTVNAILTQLVDLRDSGVVIVAATNYMDRLDGAAIREGRFDFKIEVPAPDYDARINLIGWPLANNKPEIMISPDVLDRVTQRWEGFSVARIRHVMNEVVREANQARVDRVDTKFMYEVLRRVQGRAGRIAESIPMLDALILSQQQRGVLNKIASRLIKIDEIESMGGSVPRGVLFWGPPGTGKTFTAQVLAKTAGWAFLSVSGHDLMSDGDKLDKLLGEASDIRPCVVFIDEADDVFGHRGGNAALTALTNKLLAAMDGTKGRIPDVLFIAATNHPDRFDPAALRGGRFTEKVEFANPGLPEIREFVQKWLNSLVIPRQSDVTPESVAELLVGRSNSDVKEVLQMALNEAVTRRVDMPTSQLMLRDVQVAAASV